MGHPILENAVQALRLADFDADYGYSGENSRNISAPVCTVNLQSADLFAGAYTVLVRILSPAALGAEGCEQAALEAAGALMPDTRECCVGPCSFDGRTGNFCVEITAVYETNVPSVRLNTVTMQYVRSFTSWRTVSDGTVEWSDTPWTFEIVEYIPLGSTEQAFPQEGFTVYHDCNGVTERYTSSAWTYRKREMDAGGIRQIWRGVAQTMEKTATE